jgi:hypothetical protein
MNDCQNTDYQKAENKILSCLSSVPVDIDKIVEYSDIEISLASRILTKLVILNIIHKVDNIFYIKV